MRHVFYNLSHRWGIRCQVSSILIFSFNRYVPLLRLRMGTQPDRPDGDGDWLRQWTIPEEDRAKYTSEPWRGEGRWFKASNVICLETWRPRLNPVARPIIKG